MGLVSDVLGGGDGFSAPKFKPYSGSSGFGDIDITGQRAEVSLDPKYQAIVNQLLQGIGGLSPSLSSEQLAFGEDATRTGAGFLSALESTDPFDVAEKQFERMEAILEPGRERARTRTTEQLLAQGRLGSRSHGVTPEQESLESAIEQSRRAGLAEAFGQAQGVQRQQADIAQGMGAFGLSTEQAQLQRMLESLGSATAVEALPLELGNYLANLTGQRSAHEMRGAELEAANQGGGFGDLLGGALSAGLEAYTGGYAKSLLPKKTP